MWRDQLQINWESSYLGKRVLVTGHTGFKGSHLTKWLQSLGAEVYGYSLPPPTTPSYYETLNISLAGEKIDDLAHLDALKAFVQEVEPEIVFHLAAEPLVSSSYEQPISTYQTNIMGSIHLFEALRKIDSLQALVVATTDKVYANLECTEGYSEDAPLGGHDPYSASKAALEIVSASYRKAFHLPLATARAGNVIGEGDFTPGRLLPDLIDGALNHKCVKLRSPHSIRPWQYVQDPLRGYLMLGASLMSGDGRALGPFNFGPQERHITVLEIAEKVQKKWPSFQFTQELSAIFHETKVLTLNSNKAQTVLGWKPQFSIDEALDLTLSWHESFAALSV